MNVVIWFDELNLGKGVLRDMSHLVSRLPSHIAISDRGGDWVVACAVSGDVPPPSAIFSQKYRVVAVFGG